MVWGYLSLGLAWLDMWQLVEVRRPLGSSFRLVILKSIGEGWMWLLNSILDFNFHFWTYLFVKLNWPTNYINIEQQYIACFHFDKWNSITLNFQLHWITVVHYMILISQVIRILFIAFLKLWIVGGMCSDLYFCSNL